MARTLSTGVKVFLDDERPTPDGWIHARWPEDVINHLKNGNVEEISLDHDLADPLVEGQGYCSSIAERTGYDVLVWIEEQVALNGFVPP
ncbi:MAG: cyclic-phosphate processing receiver domain-containing protein, partial [bacterium]